MRRRQAVVLVALVLVVAAATNLSAAGEITLESLAAAFSRMTQRQDELEKRLAAIEKELNIPAPQPTETPGPTNTPRPARTAISAPTPTPVVTIHEFNELVEAHKVLWLIPKIKFKDGFGYIKGQVARITEQEDGYQIEFEGSGLDLVCRLPASALPTLRGRLIGNTYVVYGYVELDRSIIADDVLLIKECSIAAVIDGAVVWLTAAPTPSLTVARDRVDGRSGPGTNHPVVVTLRKGQAFAPSGRNEAGDWLRFNSSRGYVWVYAPLMTVTGLEQVPVVNTPRPPTRKPTATRRPTSTPRPTVASRPSLTVARDRVDGRSGPGTNYPVVVTLRRGQTFTPNGRNEAGNWLRFNSSRGYVWVYAPLMTVTGLDRVRVVNTPRPPTRRPTATRRPRSTPRPTVAARPSFTVARERVNARSGPGTNFPVVGTVRRGQTFTPNGRNQAGDWLRFNSNRGYVWVYAPLMTVTGLDRVRVVNTPRPPTRRPTATRRPTSTPRPTVAARPSFTVARERVNARSGPGTNYPVVGTISRGQTFVPNGRNQAGDWLRFNSNRGYVWVYVPLLTVTGLERVPVVSAPRPPTPAPAPRPTAAPSDGSGYLSGTCTALKEQGLVPEGGWPRDHVNYTLARDRDRDDWACE